MMSIQRKKERGFTLIELLIVIAILGVLTAVGLVSFSGSQRKARDSRRKADLQSITKALEMYRNDHGQYPESNAGGLIMGCGAEVACNWGDQFVDDRGTSYMEQLPADPLNGRQYFYLAEANGKWYQIFARLENDRDLSIPHSGETALVYPNTACLTDTSDCNYGVASSNTSLPTATEELGG